MLKHKSFLWPDHVIGKRESRRIREEHNAAVNTAAELLEALKGIVSLYRDESKDSPIGIGRAAIAKAVQS